MHADSIRPSHRAPADQIWYSEGGGPGEPDGLSPWEYTVAELLSDAGYATALYGKWHVGFTHFHPPWGMHDDFEGASGAGIYADTKLEVDLNIGQILDAIRSAGIDDDTIVILTGDNGRRIIPLPASKPVRSAVRTAPGVVA